VGSIPQMQVDCLTPGMVGEQFVQDLVHQLAMSQFVCRADGLVVRIQRYRIVLI
jgi:hypothetical protein